MHKVSTIIRYSSLYNITFFKKKLNLKLVTDVGRFWNIELEVLLRLDNDICNYFVAVQSYMTSSSQKKKTLRKGQRSRGTKRLHAFLPFT